MFAYTLKSENDGNYVTVDDTKYEHTNVVLELNDKHKHSKLQNYQKYKTFHLEEPNTNKIWTYKFELKLEDTSLGESLMYQKDFSNLPTNKPFLFVATIHTCKHNLKCKKPIHLYEANKNNIKFHFLSAENDIDIISKHKGIICRLKEKDLLFFAGEVYKTDETIIYNLQSGCLRNSMFKNNENLVYNIEKQKEEKSNCDTFHQEIILPIMKSVCKKINIDNNIRKRYGVTLTYTQMENIITKYPSLKFKKTEKI
jgi:hypothetical protein